MSFLSSKKVEKLTQDNEKLSKEIAKLKQLNDKLTRESGEIRLEKGNLLLEIDSLKSQLNSFMDKFVDIEEMERKVETIKIEISSLEMERNTLSSDPDKLLLLGQENLEDLRAEIKESESRKEFLATEVNMLERKIVEKQDYYDKLMLKFDELEKGFIPPPAFAAGSPLSSDSNFDSNSTNNLQTEFDSLQEMMLSLKAEITELTVTKETLNDELFNLKTEKDQLTRTRATFISDSMAIPGEGLSDFLNSRIEELQSEIGSLQAEISRMNIEHSKEIELKVSEIEKLQIELLERNYSGNQSSGTPVSEDIAELQATIEQSREQLESVEEYYRNEIANKNFEIEQLKEQISLLSNSDSSVIPTVQNILPSEGISLETSILRSQLDEIETKYQSELEERNREIESLKMQIASSGLSSSSGEFSFNIEPSQSEEFDQLTKELAASLSGIPEKSQNEASAEDEINLLKSELTSLQNQFNQNLEDKNREIEALKAQVEQSSLLNIPQIPGFDLNDLNSSEFLNVAKELQAEMAAEFSKSTDAELLRLKGEIVELETRLTAEIAAKDEEIINLKQLFENSRNSEVKTQEVFDEPEINKIFEDRIAELQNIINEYESQTLKIEDFYKNQLDYKNSLLVELNDKITSLQNSLNSDIEITQDSPADSKSETKDSDFLKQDLTDEIDALSLQRELLLEELAELENKKNTLSAQPETKDSLPEEKENILTSLNEELELKKFELDNLNSRLHEVNSSVIEKQKHLEELTEKVQELSGKKEDLLGEINNLTDAAVPPETIQKSHLAVEELSSKLFSEKENIADLFKEKESILTEIMERKSELNSLLSEIKSNQEKLGLLLTEFNGVEANKKEVENSLVKLEFEKTSLENSILSLREEEVKLNSQLDKIGDRIAQLEESKLRLEQTNLNLEGSLADVVKRFNEDLETSKNQIQNIKTELLEKETKLNSLNKAISTKDIEKTEKTAMVESLEREINSLRSSIDSFVEQKEKSKESLLLLRDRESKARVTMNDIKRETTYLQNKKAEVEKELNHLLLQIQKRYSDLEERKSQLDEEIRNREAFLSKLNTQLEDAESKLSDIKNEIEANESRKDELVSQLMRLSKTEKSIDDQV
ncbi:MAG: hypothetical protein IAE91_15480 [Ignavibacteriaceae bacterium]|nr:hypothetical protein [Ignavibacteriaceae bacterium]